MNKPVMALAEFGRLDVLVNSAGIQFLAPLQEFPVGATAIVSVEPQGANHVMGSIAA